ncbi:tetrahydromethanopterin S-methyltransferase subunit MtrB [Methanosphaera sp.]|uniref:tetrahydromethanopterin S-methyltransferase subunit MtrB n=1 Tax=Methanosphaera sp. TaxID=2666342 RepID=UPI0025E4E2F7|nr:tetrahydromethanopterin S-methyltransferase subunit B [Methanosphaera sp.]MEE3324686.1 tetrahydromethanopterin S-methyltransferase subunit B [Methanosphaera sp.]
MVIETSKIIIDDNLEMDVNTGVIGQGIVGGVKSTAFPTEELLSQLDKIEEAIIDLESSFDPNSTSRLSQPGREGIYHKAGMLTNIVIGVILALIFILLLV